jgi:hypothetical protein
MASFNFLDPAMVPVSNIKPRLVISTCAKPTGFKLHSYLASRGKCHPTAEAAQPEGQLQPFQARSVLAKK